MCEKAIDYIESHVVNIHKECFDLMADKDIVVRVVNQSDAVKAVKIAESDGAKKIVESAIQETNEYFKGIVPVRSGGKFAKFLEILNNKLNKE